MNDDLISRSAAIEQIERREKLMTGDKRVGVEHFKTFLMNRPTVDAEPVRHGYWIPQDNTYTKFMCSDCKGRNHDGSGKYCSDCGAKMDGDANV